MCGGAAVWQRDADEGAGARSGGIQDRDGAARPALCAAATQKESGVCGDGDCDSGTGDGCERGHLQLCGCGAAGAAAICQPQPFDERGRGERESSANESIPIRLRRLETAEQVAQLTGCLFGDGFSAEDEIRHRACSRRAGERWIFHDPGRARNAGPRVCPGRRPAGGRAGGDAELWHMAEALWRAARCSGPIGEPEQPGLHHCGRAAARICVCAAGRCGVLGSAAGSMGLRAAAKLPQSLRRRATARRWRLRGKR